MASGSGFRCFIFSFSLLCVVAVIVYAFRLTWDKENNDQGNANSTGSRVNSTLKFVIVISRHGNRRLNYTIPNDPYPIDDTSFWPFEITELTKQGRIQMYNLGAKIRSLYNGFLNQNYHVSEIYSSSTAMDRVLMSGETFLAGLYPPTGFELWNRAILWQPIPLYSDSPDKTVELPDCPKYIQAQNQFFAEFSEKNASQLLEVNNYLSKHTGANITGRGGFFSVWDSFISEVSEGYVLPEWASKVYPEPMTDLAAELYILTFAGNNTVIRLVIGSFLREMLEVMKSKVNGTISQDRQIHYYSGHDSSLIALQVALGIPRSEVIGVVRPGSSMIYELHQDPKSKEFYVEVLYIDGSSTDLEPVPVSIPDCSLCDFNQFVNISEKFVVTNFEKECQLNSTNTHNLY